MAKLSDREFRMLVLHLLDSDGITESAYMLLKMEMHERGCSDITVHVRATDGMFYIREEYTADEFHKLAQYMQDDEDVNFAQLTEDDKAICERPSASSPRG